MKKLAAIPVTILTLLFATSTTVHAISHQSPGAAAQTMNPGTTAAPEEVPATPATSPDSSIQPKSSPGVNPNSDIDVSASPTQGS